MNGKGNEINLNDLDINNEIHTNQVCNEELKINEKRKKELEEKNEIERLKIFYENIVETIAEGLWQINLEGQTIYVNKQMADMLGYSIEDISNRNYFDFVDKSYIENAKEVFERRKQGIKERYETELIKKDGSTIFVSISASPLFEDNKVIGAIGLITDITNQKYIENKLIENEEKYRTIVEYSNDLIWTEDTDGRFTFCNKRAEKLVGYKLEELKGKHFSEYIAKEDIPKVIDLFNRVLKGQAVEYETSFINRYDKKIIIAVNKAPIYSKGKIIGTTAFGRDVTAQKLAEENIKNTTEELARSNKELEQFAYIASHDLQEPLRTISSFTELLATRYRGNLDSEADEFIEYIISGSRRMQEMINDILTISRINAKVKFKYIDIKNVIVQSLKNLKDLIEKNDAIIKIDNMPIVCGDEPQLIQLFQNLIENAIKFRKKEEIPQIWIRSKKKNNEWIFSIQDNGIGIDPKDFKKLFIIFHRLHSRDEYPGTGIGLAICKKIVTRHGGKIWVESKYREEYREEYGEGYREGSIFYFSIPELPPSHIKK